MFNSSLMCAVTFLALLGISQNNDPTSPGFLNGVELRPRSGVVEPIPVNAGKALKICEVLQNLARFSGQIIEIRDVWDAKFESNCSPLKTGAYVWLNGINLFLPDAKESPSNPWRGISVSTFAMAYRGAAASLAELPAAQRTHAKVVATFVGLLDTTNPPLQLRFPNVPNGFGEQGVYPARLVLWTVKDIAIAVDGKEITLP